MVLITPLICCVVHFLVLAEVLARIFAGGVSVFLDLLFCLFFCRYHGFSGDPLDVL